MAEPLVVVATVQDPLAPVPTVFGRAHVGPPTVVPGGIVEVAFAKPMMSMTIGDVGALLVMVSVPASVPAEVGA